MCLLRLLSTRRGFTILAVVLGSLTVASCTRPNPLMVRQLAQLQAPSQQKTLSINELQREVARYQGEVDRIYASTRKLGRVYQMLALKYFNSQMYGPALRSFKEAINVYPTNPVLAYMAGLCQAQLAKAEVDPQVQKSMFEEAATYYQHALSMNDSYKDALYALSVVDIFELDKSREAEPYLKKLVSLDPGDTNALFLLARVYVAEGKPQEAAGIYDKIIAGNASAGEKAKAQANKGKVLEGAFGK